MPIAVECPCGKKSRFDDKHAGKKLKCPACKSTLTLPLPSDSKAKLHPKRKLFFLWLLPILLLLLVIAGAAAFIFTRSTGTRLLVRTTVTYEQPENEGVPDGLDGLKATLLVETIYKSDLAAFHDPSLSVRTEHGFKNKDRTEDPVWTENERSFDFVVTRDIKTRRRPIEPNKPPIVDIDEDWTITKRTDSTVTKNWKCNFVLVCDFVGGQQKHEAPRFIENVVKPARGKLDQELPAFIAEHTKRSK